MFKVPGQKDKLRSAVEMVMSLPNNVPPAINNRARASNAFAEAKRQLRIASACQLTRSEKNSIKAAHRILVALSKSLQQKELKVGE